MDLPSTKIEGSGSTPSLSATGRINKNGTEAEDNNESVSNSSTREKALQNSLVLQNIFKFLPYDDLLTCRSVDLPYWSSEAEYAVLQRPILNIKLNPPRYTMMKIFQGKKVLLQFQDIWDLIEKLKISEKGHEIYMEVCNAASPCVKIFLNEFANVIYNLVFRQDSLLGRFSPRDLQILLCSLPKLTNLTMTEVPNRWERQRPAESWNLSILLPQIQTITFSPRSFDFRQRHNATFLEDFFQVLPNLKGVFGFPIQCIDILRVGGSINPGAIKSVDASFSSIASNNLQQKLLQWESISWITRLQTVHINLKNSAGQYTMGLLQSCYESLSNILWNNQDTLEYLFIEPLSFPQFLKYPEMKAVKKLNLSILMNETNARKIAHTLKFLQIKFDARKAFPNLVEITFDGTGHSLEEFLKYFPEDAFSGKYFEGVVSLNLKFKYYLGIEALDKVANLVQGITSLIIDSGVGWLESGLAEVSRLWPKLTSLKLKVDITGYQNIFDKYILDPVFTGISASNCTELRKYEKRMDIDLKVHKSKFGLPAMTELRELTLVFDGKNSNIQEVIPLVSHLTCFYGFQCLPDLKVTCAIPWDNKDSEKIREMLSPIEKYVAFNPNYY